MCTPFACIAFTVASHACPHSPGARAHLGLRLPASPISANQTLAPITLRRCLSCSHGRRSEAHDQSGAAVVARHLDVSHHHHGGRWPTRAHGALNLPAPLPPKASPKLDLQKPYPPKLAPDAAPAWRIQKAPTPHWRTLPFACPMRNVQPPPPLPPCSTRSPSPPSRRFRRT